MIEIASIVCCIVTVIVSVFLLYWFFFRETCDKIVRDYDGKVVCNPWSPLQPDLALFIKSMDKSTTSPLDLEKAILARDPTANPVIVPEGLNARKGMYPPGTIIIPDSAGKIKFSVSYVTRDGAIAPLH